MTCGAASEEVRPLKGPLRDWPTCLLGLASGPRDWPTCWLGQAVPWTGPRTGPSVRVAGLTEEWAEEMIGGISWGLELVHTAQGFSQTPACANPPNPPPLALVPNHTQPTNLAPPACTLTATLRPLSDHLQTSQRPVSRVEAPSIHSSGHKALVGWGTRTGPSVID